MPAPPTQRMSNALGLICAVRLVELVARVGLTSAAESVANEMKIDCLACRLASTLGHPDRFTAYPSRSVLLASHDASKTVLRLN